MIRAEFTPWRRFRAVRDDALIQAFLHKVADATHSHFRASMEASRGGRLYTQKLRWVRGRVRPVGPRGAPHRASAPGAYPARNIGRLIGSIRRRVTALEMEIGTMMHYATYLKHGTRIMAKRKMSKEALRETYPKVRGTLGRFARWRHE